MSNRPINLDALRAQLEDLADRADELLGMQADPAAFEGIAAILRELEDRSFELAHAQTATRILQSLANRLYTRGAALAEVHGLDPSPIHWQLVTDVGLQQFGPRFCAALGPNGLTDDDVPF